MAATLLQDLMKTVAPERITVIDFAPQRINGIGGKLTNYMKLTSGLKYASPRMVYAPRLMATSPEQLLQLADMNRKAMKPLLKDFLKNPTNVLVINDITLYFHSGELKTILSCVKTAGTFLGTAYYGSRLERDLGTGISSRERALTDELARFMDLVVKCD